MTVHYACLDIFRNLINAILVRAEMDESVFQLIQETGRDWKLVRKAIDPAMSKKNVEVQEIFRELLQCECPIYREERAKGLRS